MKLWYSRGFFPSDSSNCCKLQHFVCCLCSISKHAMLSYALRILRKETMLQLEIRWQHDPNDSWREETHRNSYTHREAVLRFYTEELFYTKAFPPRSFYTQKLLYKEVFTQHIDASTHRNFYTEKPLQRELVHMEAFTRIEIFVYRRAFTLRNFHTQKLSPREVFFNFADWFYKQTLLHGKAFAQRSFCTEAPWLEVKS